MPGPWDKYRTQANAPQGGVVIGQPDPRLARTALHQDHEDQRADAAQRMEQQRLEIQRRSAEQEARLREITIQIAQNKLSQGDGALPPPPGDVNKTGDEYLATLPRGMAPTIKSVLEGRQAPPSSFALSKPYWQQIMSAANQADPTFDQSQWQARVQVRKQYESQAARSPGAVINSVNTLAAHANSMYKNHLQMAGPNLGPLSGTVAGAIQSWDQKNTPAYNTEISFVQGELQKLVSQGQSNQAEADRILHNLRSAQSFGARTEAIKALVEMAQGKIQPLHDGWTSVMGDLPMPTDITPSSRAVFDNILAEGKQALKVDQNGTPIVPGSIADRRDDRPWAVPSGHGYPPGGGSGSGGPPPAGGGVNRTNIFIDNTPVDQRGTASASTAQYVAENDPKTAAIVDHWIRMGKSGAEINAQLERLGLHGATVDPAQVTLAQNYLKTPAGRSYNHNLASATRQVEQSPMERAGNVMGLSTVGAGTIGAYGGLNSLTFGGLGAASDAITGMPGQSDLAISTAHQAHPWAAGAGEMVGTLPAFVGAEAGLAKLAARGIGSSPVAAALAGSPLTADAVGGAYVGAGSNPNDRIGGAITGGLAGVGGGFVGRNVVARALATAGRSAPVSAVSNALLRARGLPEVAAPPKLSVAEALVSKAANKAGVDGINAQLTQASRMGVPMALADTDQGLTTLAGSAARRSASAAQLAEDTLAPRSRGQIDRLGTAVERDLGPIGNVPQISADLAKKAKADAGPLYDLSNAQPIPGTPEIASLLETPFGREGLSKARTIMANDRVSPTELGFSQDSEGNTLLNPQPNRQIANHLAARAELDDAQNAYRMARNGTGDMEAARARVQQARDGVRQAEQGLNTSNDPMLPANGQNYTMQALDYAKQGMDDVLEQHRNEFGKMEMGPLANSQNTVKNQLLAEVDRLNPHYASARAAYGGPMQSRDAMALGQDAYSMNPNELAVGLQGKSPEQMAQIQLGHRDALMSNAEKLRYSTNPWEATLGNPAAEQRLNTLYPDKPSVAQLLAQRDMEATMASTKKEVLDGSPTARRTLADRAFGLATAPSLAFDAGMIAMGHPPLATAALLASKGAKLGWDKMAEKGAIAQADAVAPMLLNTNPDASAAILRNLMDSSQAYQDYIRANNPRLAGPLGVVGAGTGAATFAN